MAEIGGDCLARYDRDGCGNDEPVRDRIVQQLRHASWKSKSASVRVLVLSPRAGLGGLGFRRSLEQEVVIGRDERVGRHHRVRVVDGPVLPRERYPGWALAQPVFELGSYLA